MAKIVISVGHTPQEPGAKVGELTEFDLASKIATEAANLLKEQKYDAYTVPYDLDLAATIEWINSGAFSTSENDVCVDLHVNDGGGSGIEGWHKDRGENKSFKLTKSIVEGVAKATSLPALGAKSEYDHPFKSLAFVHNTNCISALVECGFMDSPADAALLRTEEGIKKFAIGVVNGVKDFLANLTVQSMAQPATKPPVSPVGQAVASPVAQPLAQQMAPAMPGAQAKNVALPLGTPGVSQTGLPFPAQGDAFGFGDAMGFGAPVGSFGGYGGTGGERRNMIKKIYNEVLGREADPKGLTYYLYTNPTATEEQIRKEMTQSTEHVEMVKEAGKSKANAKRIVELEEEISLVRVNLESRENELMNFQKLLQMKNQELQRLKVKAGKGVPADELNLASEKKEVFPANYAKNVEPDIKRATRPRGCLGWIRGLLGI